MYILSEELASHICLWRLYLERVSQNAWLSTWNQHECKWCRLFVWFFSSVPLLLSLCRGRVLHTRVQKWLFLLPLWGISCIPWCACRGCWHLSNAIAIRQKIDRCREAVLSFRRYCALLLCFTLFLLSCCARHLRYAGSSFDPWCWHWIARNERQWKHTSAVKYTFNVRKQTKTRSYTHTHTYIYILMYQLKRVLLTQFGHIRWSCIRRTA